LHEEPVLFIILHRKESSLVLPFSGGKRIGFAFIDAIETKTRTRTGLGKKGSRWEARQEDGVGESSGKLKD
jgi:hypothetical protein